MSSRPSRGSASAALDRPVRSHPDIAPTGVTPLTAALQPFHANVCLNAPPSVYHVQGGGRAHTMVLRAARLSGGAALRGARLGRRGYGVENVVTSGREMAMEPRIHHVMVAMPANREEQARRFYGALLGLEESEKPANLRGRGGVWFMTGALQLHLGVDPDFRTAEKAHVAFEVVDLAGVRSRLAAAGYDATDDEPLAGFDRCYVKDPFGNRVELLESRP